MLDIWMIFCIIYPFLIVVFYALSEFLIEEKDDYCSFQKALAKTAMIMILKFGLPLLSISFIFIFWLLGISNYLWPDVETLCNI